MGRAGLLEGFHQAPLARVQQSKVVRHVGVPRPGLIPAFYQYVLYFLKRMRDTARRGCRVGNTRLGAIDAFRLSRGRLRDLPDAHRCVLVVSVLADRIPFVDHQFVDGASTLRGVPVAEVERHEHFPRTDVPHGHAPPHDAAPRRDTDPVAVRDPQALCILACDLRSIVPRGRGQRRRTTIFWCPCESDRSACPSSGRMDSRRPVPRTAACTPPP